MAEEILVGVIADTHGLLRPEAVDALRGSQMILHAGDVGREIVLEGLRAIAPTVAVRGNVDGGAWASVLPEETTIEIGGFAIYMRHELAALDVKPSSAGFAAVITGHSHRPAAEHRGGVLYLNPGSAGPRRFSLPITVARLRIADGRLAHELIELRVRPPA